MPWLGIAMETCLALAARRAVGHHKLSDIRGSLVFTESDISSHLMVLSIKLSAHLTYFKREIL